MNEGQFNHIKTMLGELIKRHDRLIELFESQMTQPVAERPDAEDKVQPNKPEKPAKAPEPIVQVDERTAEQMERAGDFEPVKSKGKPDPDDLTPNSAVVTRFTTKATKK